MKKKNITKIFILFILFFMLVGSVKKTSATKISMAYLYGNYDYVSLINRNSTSVNVVSPSYFDLNDNGNLSLNYVDKNLINEMHEKNIKVTPFLSNHWDREKGRKALKNYEKLSNELVEVIYKYNLDGINIDIENLNENDRESYINFVKVLKEKLGDSKTVSVAVAANPYDYKTGWQGSYDYNMLSKYADYIIIMAYDEHYEGGEEGAVASKDFIENSIKYALSKVSAEKIVVGLPFYGRYWKSGVAGGGYGVTLNKIEKLIKEYDSTVEYDTKSATAKVIIKIKAGDLKPSINGRTLYAGTYIFYFENAKSINEKISLIEKYNLKGIGCWSLGQETEEVFENYSRFLNEEEKDFLDIDEVNWASEAIKFAKDKGLINGRTLNYYKPKEYLTRAEFVAIVTRMLELEVNDSSETLYYDVSAHWAKNEINLLTKTRNN